MHSGRSLAGLALLGLLMATPAQAHKLKIFATADGGAISGYAYFFGGGRVVDTRIMVTDPAGHTVTELRTDTEGVFRFNVAQRQDYRLTVDSGDGHVASTTVTTAPLPEPWAMADATEIALRPSAAETVAAAPEVAPAVAPPAMTPPDVATLVEGAVSHQIRPLREQIDAWNDRILLHDVLGGLGYILGLAGLAYGLTARRQPKGGDGASGA